MMTQDDLQVSQSDLMTQAMTHFRGFKSASDRSTGELRQRQEAAAIAHQALQSAMAVSISLKLKGRGKQGKRHYMPNFGMGSPLQRCAGV